MNTNMNTRQLGLQLGLTKTAADIFTTLARLSSKISGKPGVDALAKMMRKSPNVAEQLVGHAAKTPLYKSEAMQAGQPLADNLLKLFGEHTKKYPTNTAFEQMVGFSNSLDPRTLSKAPMSALMSNRKVLKSMPGFTEDLQKALKQINAV